MTWTEHTSKTASKGNKSLGFLRRNLRNCTPTVREATYKSLVRPILEYASTVWDPADRDAGDIAALEKVQRRAARYAQNNYIDRYPGCVTGMLNSLGWEPLSNRRYSNRLIMLYRMQSNQLDIDTSDLLKKADCRTRGNSRLYQDHSQQPVLHNNFFPRTIRQWNNLPTSLTDSPSLDHFKAGLGRLTRQGHLP